MLNCETSSRGTPVFDTLHAGFPSVLDLLDVQSGSLPRRGKDVWVQNAENCSSGMLSTVSVMTLSTVSSSWIVIS